MIKKVKSFIGKYCPRWAVAAYALFIAAAVIHIISLNSASFSDFYSRYIGSVVRALLAKLTNVFPFSIAETIIICLPILVGLMFWGGIRSIKKGNTASVRYICGLFAPVTLFYSTFVCGFATAYNGSTLESKLDIERRKLSADELYQTAVILLDRTEELSDEINYKYGGASVMPYSLSEMNTLLNDAYDKACDKYGFVSRLRSNVKSIMLSEPMTYTHISGVYTYYTGEANINTNFPDYSLPYTAAHELSHQRGIAREDEANFMAFLVCLESDDPYILYSGYLNMFEYVFSALYSADSGLYYDILSDMDMRVRYEMIAYSEFFDKYRESVASEVSTAVNDTFLKSQGQEEGTKSYGRVVDLAVAYYIPAPDEESENG